ncbi:hypothetical protein ACHAXR_008354 [Thalassiosira sp. AJA248-18]
MVSQTGFSQCKDNGQFERSFGKLFYQPDGTTAIEQAVDLSLILTAGRLSDNNLAAITNACASQPNKASRIQCMQQIIVTTPEFHTTNLVIHSGDDRNTQDDIEDGGAEPYKALVYFDLRGGSDSHNMLTPYTCAPIDVYGRRYRNIRGKSVNEEGVGLPLSRLLEIPANNPAQPCSSFGIHEELTVLEELYENVNFIANVGLLAKPVNTSNYKGETPVQLFAHNTMTRETNKNDIADKYMGTGVGGRMADALTNAGISVNTFSIKGQTVFLSGETGGPSLYTISSDGLSPFNENPSIHNMTDVVQAVNQATNVDSVFFAETYSSKLTDAIRKHRSLKTISNKMALSRGRMIPTHPWDAIWKGTAEWFGVTSSDIDKVLPMHKNFPPELLYGRDDLFVL